MRQVTTDNNVIDTKKVDKQIERRRQAKRRYTGGFGKIENVCVKEVREPKITISGHGLDDLDYYDVQFDGLSPDKQFAASMILRALCDLACPEKCWKDSSKRWFVSDSEECPSFIWCCEVINTAPEAILSQVKRFSETRINFRWRLFP